MNRKARWLIDRLKAPRRHAHFVYGVIQSGLTTALATAVATFNSLATESFLFHWLRSWAIAWALMLPVVVAAAPLLRRLTLCLTRQDS